MKAISRIPGRRLVALLTFCGAFDSFEAGAQTVSTWNGSTGNWSDSSLWIPALVPNSAEADVFINATTPEPHATMDGSFTVGRLSVYADDQTGGSSAGEEPLRLGANAILTVVAGAFPGSGQINNRSFITSVTALTPMPALQLSGDVTISGVGGAVGQVLLSNRTISGLTESSSLTIGKEQVIAGGGNVGGGSLAITNGGNIEARFANVPLVIEPRGGTTMLNNGSITASQGAIEFSGGATLTNNSEFNIFASAQRQASMIVPAGALTNFAGSTLSGGSYELSAPDATRPARLSLGGNQITINDAVVSLSGPGTVFEEIGAVAENRGFFILASGRNFTTAGALTNDGFVSTDASTLTANGAFTQSAGGKLNGGTMIAESFAIEGDVYMGDEVAPSGASHLHLFQPGTLNLQGNVNLGPAAILNFELSDAASVNDRIKIVGDFVLDGTLMINRVFSRPNFGPATYDLIEFSGAFTDNGLKLGIVPAGFEYQLDSTSQPGRFLLIVGPSNTPARLLNISTRLRAQPGDNALIGGFILTGSDIKRVIVRAIGPSLSTTGVQGALADTTLELFDSAGELLAGNDNWRDTQEAELQATTIPPGNDLEAAIVITLPAGNAGYTAIVRGKGEVTGIALVEVYDLDQGGSSRLANISTRGVVETGEDAMIGGFIVGAGGAAGVVVRAVGPSLSDAGVAGALENPTLALVNSDGIVLAENDDWTSTRSRISATGIPPTNDAESAIVAGLPPGNYTAVVRGKDGGTGVGLVEVYNLQ